MKDLGEVEIPSHVHKKEETPQHVSTGERQTACRRNVKQQRPAWPRMVLWWREARSGTRPAGEWVWFQRRRRYPESLFNMLATVVTSR